MVFKNNNPSCPCCCGCDNKDVLLLTDTTGSMASYLTSLKQIFNALEEDFDSTTCRWSVAVYKDVEDGTSHWDGTSSPIEDYTNGWHVLQTFTDDFSLVLAAVNSMTHAGGGDIPEQNFMALKNAGDEWVSTLLGRTDPEVEAIILWGGDAPSWNAGAKSFDYPSRADTITSLTTANIKVFGLNAGGAGAGIDGQAGTDNSPGQASDICTSTGGTLTNSVNFADWEEIRDVLCNALRG